MLVGAVARCSRACSSSELAASGRRRPRRPSAAPTTHDRDAKPADDAPRDGDRAHRPPPISRPCALRLQPVVDRDCRARSTIAFRPVATGSPGTMYVAEQAGTLRRIVDGRRRRAPRSTSAATSAAATSRASSARRSRPTARSSTSTTPTRRRHERRRVHDERRRRRPEHPPACAVRRPAVPEPQRRRGDVRARRRCSTSGSATAAARATRTATGRTSASLLGKILRINPTARGSAPYSVPEDNPFVGRAGASRESWMYGLRNPWRFSFDRATGRRVDRRRRPERVRGDRLRAEAASTGINWGWSQREGIPRVQGRRPAGARDPIVETTHADGSCAIVGGYVYRGRAIPALDGVYLYGDNCRPNIDGVVQRGGRAIATARPRHHRSTALTTFGEDRTGELYVAARGGTDLQVRRGATELGRAERLSDRGRRARRVMRVRRDGSRTCRAPC